MFGPDARRKSGGVVLAEGQRHGRRNLITPLVVLGWGWAKLTPARVTPRPQPPYNPRMETNNRAAWDAYKARTDLEQYAPNGLLLFVAQLRLDFDDLGTFASNSLTDGSNDKKCDLVAVHRDSQRLIVAQGFESGAEKSEAPSNKASDLNTAVTWLLSGNTDDLPETLKSAAIEARDALVSDEIRELQIWYVHNLPESDNVMREMSQSATTAKSLLERHFPGASVDVTAYEIGRNTIEDDYRKTRVAILVSDEVSFEVPGGFEVSGDGWTAYSTAISAAELRKLWGSHQTRLMSPNIRDYLGIVRSAGNINYGIKQTAISQPSNFAIFNNGITVLVNNYKLEVVDGRQILKVKGIGVVNGGQTTGALGTLDESDASHLADAQVMARFVSCSKSDVLSNIVRYNNTQNKVEATDFRSKDPIQERLRVEFNSIPEAEYRGGRRGGASDAIQRIRTLLPDSSVAQSLAAFHGDPNLAYNETRTIWDSDGIYSSVFRDTVSARHIVLAFGLLKAVERAKQKLTKIPDESRTAAQKKHAQFFSARGSTFLLVAAIAGCVETILDRPINDKHALIFRENLSPAAATDAWQPVVDTVLAFSTHLQPAADQGLKSRERVANAFTNFAAMVEATRTANVEPFDALAKSVIDPPV